MFGSIKLQNTYRTSKHTHTNEKLQICQITQKKHLNRQHCFSANMMASVAGQRRSGWKGVTTTLCVDISESMATAETWGQVREFVGSFLQGENEGFVNGGVTLPQTALFLLKHNLKLYCCFPKLHNSSH